MKISVGIPTYNRAENLARTLKSFYIQKFPKDRYEIIVVDDGSTDDGKTRLVCEEAAKHCTLRYTYRKPNHPPLKPDKTTTPHQGSAYRHYNAGFGYNIALRQAEGDIFMVTMSDEIQITPTLRQMWHWHHKFKKKPFPLIVGGVREFHLDENWDTETPIDWKDLPKWLETAKRFDITGRTVPYQYCYAVATDFMRKIRGWDEDYIYPAWEDKDLETRFIISAVFGSLQIVMDDSILVAHQWHTRTEHKPDSEQIIQKKVSEFVIRNRGREWGKL